MTPYAFLLVVLPLAGAAGSALAGLGGSDPRLPGSGRRVATPSVLALAATVAVAAAVLADAERLPSAVHTSAVLWAPTGSGALTVGTRITGLSAVMAVMVALVGLLVQVYSVAYMRGDRRIARYTAEVSLFVAAMQLVVVGSNLLEILVGWEVMGLCSYLLVGHYSQQAEARAAAVKAFVVTRIGDVGFLLGIVVLGSGAGSYDVDRVLAAVPTLGHRTVVAGTLLLLAGVVGKSAQFPLHVWLPDAMAGPTPVSALIHAATMVAAGIYVVALLFPVFAVAQITLHLFAAIAAVTMLGAALCALAEDDLKRVLAWSTVSQLGYMAAALSVGGLQSSIYALLAHASYKALLFLAAGSVLRAVGTNRMSDMGGLARAMPWTFAATVVGGLALAGIPPFAGAFGKDAVLAAMADRGGKLGTGLYAVGLVTAFVTACYVTRLVVRTFLGARRGPAGSESGITMLAPLGVLAVAVVALGLPALSSSYGVRRWLGQPADTLPVHVSAGGVVLSTAIALAGIGVTTLVWSRDRARDPVRVLGVLSRPLQRAFWLDDFYGVAVVRPLAALSSVVRAADQRLLAPFVLGVGTTAVAGGGVLRRLQNGNVQAYLTALVVGVLAVAAGVGIAVAR